MSPKSILKAICSNKYSAKIKPRNQYSDSYLSLFRALLMAKMSVYLPMDKLALEKLLLYSVQIEIILPIKMLKNIEELSTEVWS